MSPRKFGCVIVGACVYASACNPDLSVLEGASFTELAGSPPTEPQGGADESAGMGGASSGAVPGAGGAHHEGGGGGNGGSGAGGGNGGAIGIYGAAGATPPGCMPSPEICNDIDDDCDGAIDPGCPGGVETTFEKDMQLLGDGSAGQAFTDDCKDGELLTGVSVAMGQYLSQIAGVCRSVSLERNANAEHGYKVTLDAERPLAAHPTSTTLKPVRLSCPQDEVIVGMRLAQQNFAPPDGPSGPVTTRIWITCAKLMLTATTDQSQLEWSGAKEQAPISGSIADQTAWLVQASAPDKLVASRLIGASSERAERVSFGVSRLNLLTR